MARFRNRSRRRRSYGRMSRRRGRNSRRTKSLRSYGVSRGGIRL